jgi:hypothetical protein
MIAEALASEDVPAGRNVLTSPDKAKVPVNPVLWMRPGGHHAFLGDTLIYRTAA